MDSHPIVVPVRFSGGGLALQSTTSRMSAEAAFVRSIVSPKEGVQMTVVLFLPGERLPLQLAGRVTEIVPIGSPGKEAGFWVAFASLPAEASKRLEDFLIKRRGAHPTPQAPIERRSFGRAPARLKVSWRSARDFLQAWSQNISRGGVFVATNDPPPLREVVELQLELPDGEPPARTKAEVVQRTTPEEARASGRAAGAGLQFIGGDDEFRRRLDACLEKLLK
ncbi:MAG: TIGR02266 family protein [Deltaproteobacteria bacterium]|nr:MAG: TIGR02266 family protein [Deltaproteobacteria bacterium]